jgi:hypothetical protein
MGHSELVGGLCAPADAFLRARAMRSSFVIIAYEFAWVRYSVACARCAQIMLYHAAEFSGPKK